MGQHKTNPTAIAAKRGELPPKPKPMSKLETEQWLWRQVARRYANFLYLPKPQYESVSVELAKEVKNG